jgi:hypothetical protein
VYSLIKVTVFSRDIYVLLCVFMALLWYCVVMMCGFLEDVLCVLYFVELRIKKNNEYINSTSNWTLN